MNLSEQVVLLTGGAGSIGRHLVQDLQSVVRQVHVVDKNAEALSRLAAELPVVQTHACDITDFDSVQATVGAAFQADPAPTVLINNAGLIHSEPLVNLMAREDRKHGLDSWRTTIDSNLNSVFYMTLCFADEMAQRRLKGAVINISSISSEGNAGQSAYSAAKAAVNALTVTWSRELGILGIRCAAIAPGFIGTESTQASLSEAHLKNYKKRTPVGRLGAVEEVASAVRFVIENDFYNGRILRLDGGLSL